MTYSNDYLWLAIIVLFAILQISAALLLFSERSGGTWMMMIGSILSGSFSLGSRMLYHLRPTGFLEINWEKAMQCYPILFIIATFGSLLFLIGLVLFSLRRRALASHIAELEQIIAAQNSRLH